MGHSHSFLSPHIVRAQLRRFLGWFILALFSLLASCVVFELVYAFMIHIVWPDMYNGRSRTFQLLSLIPESLLAGIVVALMVGIMWDPPAFNGRWLVVNAFCMASGTWATIQSFDMMARYGYSFGVWLAITASIGSGVGSIQWLMLRRRTAAAGWWIPAMAASWTLVWLLWYTVTLILGD